MSLRWRNIGKRRTEIFSIIKPNTTIAVFDTETMGIKSHSKIIQFSGIKFRITPELTLDYIDEMDIYINPEEPIPAKITQITGITDDMVSTAKTEKECYMSIFEWLESSDVLAAYNKKFDIDKLYGMAERTRYFFDDPQTIDVLEMSRDFISLEEVSDYTLKSVMCFFFPDDATQFHSAIEDVKATSKILQILLRKYYKYDAKLESEGKNPVHLEKARGSINPRRQSQQRLTVKIQEGNMGDIYYDAVKKVWSCKCDTKSKKLFNSIDLNDLERQVLDAYGYRFGNNTIDDVARDMIKFERNRKKKKSA